MAQLTGRFEWVSKVGLATLIGAVLALALWLADVVVAGYAHMAHDQARSLADILPYVVKALGILAGVGASFALYGVLRAVLSVQMTSRISAGRAGRIEALLSGQTEDMRELVHLTSLSDGARRLAFRDNEIAVLREAVHHELIKQDYQAVEAMLDTLETDLGYASEATRLREELGSSRRGTLDEQIDAASNRIQAAVDDRDWDRAMRQAKLVFEMFPEHDKASSLPRRVTAAKAKHKRNLLHAYDQAVSKQDIDLGIDLLKELDVYLTPQEAAALEESARGVFRAKLHNLGVQFAIRVTDQNWSEALTIGEQIVDEYPNSRMAQEVQDKIDMLRTRAQPTV